MARTLTICMESLAAHGGKYQLLTSATTETKIKSSRDRELAPSAQAQHQVQRRLLLDVVVGQRAAVLELLAREDQALLVGGDACV